MGPLTGLRVVELAGLGPGPLACRMLSDLGADVLRVDRLRGGREHDVNGQGRATLVVDLKSQTGRQAVLDAVAVADVLVEGFRPGAAERLGLGPADCEAVNPQLVYARMTGWGQTGPLAARAGHDINYIAVTGALHAIGERGGKPVVPANLVGDFGGGTMLLLVGILAALHERDRSGLGQVVDAAIVDGVSALMGMTWDVRELGMWDDRRGTNLLDGGAHFYATYPCKDAGFVAVGAIEPQFYAQLLEVLHLGDDAPMQEPSQWARGREVFAAAFAKRTRDEWTAAFEGTDACVTPVLSLAEAPDGHHLADRGTLVRGAGLRVRPAPAPRFSRTPGSVVGASDAETMLARWHPRTD